MPCSVSSVACQSQCIIRVTVALSYRNNHYSDNPRFCLLTLALKSFSQTRVSEVQVNFDNGSRSKAMVYLQNALAGVICTNCNYDGGRMGNNGRDDTCNAINPIEVDKVTHRSER